MDSARNRVKLVLVISLSAISSMALALRGAEPPKGHTFPVGKMRTYVPSASEVLKAPADVKGDFDVAGKPPVIDFGILPGQWRGALLWSNWGDSLFAANGKYYCSIGDHAKGHGHCYVYKVDPVSKSMEMVADYNEVVGIAPQRYAPGKIHGPLMAGGDGWIYFIGFRGGGTTDEYGYKGDWMLRYNLTTGRIENLGIPVPKCSAPTSMIHRPSMVVYGIAEPGTNAGFQDSRFFAYGLTARKLLYFGGPQPNTPRTILMVPDGCVYYSHTPGLPPKPVRKRMRRNQLKELSGLGAPVLVKYDPKTNKVLPTKAKVPGDGVLRAASRPDASGVAYCVTKDGVVFSFDTKTEKIREITKTFVAGPPYTTTCRLSPDERFLYYAPSAHGGSDKHGTVVIQLDLKTGRRKVLSFLHEYIRKQVDYHLGGTFGIALNGDGSQLFLCWNGRLLNEQISAEKTSDFGVCSVMILHIPQSER